LHWTKESLKIFVLDIFVVLFHIETADYGVAGNRTRKTRRKKHRHDSLLQDPQARTVGEVAHLDCRRDIHDQIMQPYHDYSNDSCPVYLHMLCVSIFIPPSEFYKPKLEILIEFHKYNNIKFG
jgi:hypothetical protein